jgi:predicted unusual protein kinase regulating ubiquinone biosynthesis (AarF/ABC1/UbiB family)
VHDLLTALYVSTLDCDPHPGNLLRTQDGRLCILDFGMVTRLDKDLQLTLIEHMAVRKKDQVGRRIAFVLAIFMVFF